MRRTIDRRAFAARGLHEPGGSVTTQETSEERCACVSPDALRCMQIRYSVDPDEDFVKQRCECVCHSERDYGDDYDDEF